MFTVKNSGNVLKTTTHALTQTVVTPINYAVPKFYVMYNHGTLVQLEKSGYGKVSGMNVNQIFMKVLI